MTFSKSNEHCGHSYGARDASLPPPQLSLKGLSNSRKRSKNNKLNTKYCEILAGLSSCQSLCVSLGCKGKIGWHAMLESTRSHPIPAKSAWLLWGRLELGWCSAARGTGLEHWWCRDSCGELYPEPQPWSLCRWEPLLSGLQTAVQVLQHSWGLCIETPQVEFYREEVLTQPRRPHWWVVSPMGLPGCWGSPAKGKVPQVCSDLVSHVLTSHPGEHTRSLRTQTADDKSFNVNNEGL